MDYRKKIFKFKLTSKYQLQVIKKQFNNEEKGKIEKENVF